MLITKTDIVNANLYTFSANIPDREVNPSILLAEQLDFVPIVPTIFYTDLQVVPSPADELYAFRLNFVTPLLVCFFFKRFTPVHGKAFTQFGIRQIKEDTSDEVSETGKAELISDFQSKINVYLTRFWNELKRVEYKFDGVTYDFDCKDKKPRIRIKAI